jgi:hypothetical protein
VKAKITIVESTGVEMANSRGNETNVETANSRGNLSKPKRAATDELQGQLCAQLRNQAQKNTAQRRKK